MRLEIETRQATLAATSRNPAAGIEARSSSREQAEQERRAREQQERLREQQEELERIQEEVDDAWGKVGRLFGGGDGLADTQEFRIGGDVSQLTPARNLSTLPR